jgi:hypothetical protein
LEVDVTGSAFGPQLDGTSSDPYLCRVIAKRYEDGLVMGRSLSVPECRMLKLTINKSRLSTRLIGDIAIRHFTTLDEFDDMY